MKKYTIKDFQREFPDDASCLEWLKEYRWPNGIFCKACGKITKHHLMTTRRSFSCQECGNHVHPTAGTIYHKSPTSLTTWFYTIYLMAQTRGGISAKQIERETGVTYKTAWRMCKLIRTRLDEGHDPLSGEVEVDETYFGGARKGKRGRGAAGKTPVVGLIQRRGKLKTKTVSDVKRKTLIPIVINEVEPGTTIYTDEMASYQPLEDNGYSHHTIPHGAKIYAIGNVHTNTIEGFWSLVKRGIGGVYHSVSPKYLQNYVNEYAFRYNHRDDAQPMFQTFLSRAGLVSGH